MPELPEVETTRRQIAPHLLGRTIEGVDTTAPSYFFLTPPRQLRALLPGRTFTALERHGKYLLAELDDESHLLLHLGMTGQLFSEGANSLRLLSSTSKAALTPESQTGFSPDQHTHLSFRFDDGGARVFFRDVRKFGKVRHLPPGQREPRLDKLGPDALQADVEDVWRHVTRRKIPIKTLLLNQSVIAGCGNIYADEALFLAGVRPTRSASRVSRAKVDAILSALKQVLLRSIETGGSSISDYVRPDGEDGGYQDERRVYARTGEPCLTCGAAIKRVVIATRSSHFCPSCQPR